MGRCSFPRAVSVPARGAGEASETGREQPLAHTRATQHFDPHAAIPRIQRGTAAGGGRPVTDKDTSPASVRGGTKKKTAEPRTAMVRCTAVPDTRCELTPTSPSWFPVVIRVPTRSPCYPKSGNRARLKPECHGGNEAQG